MLKRSYRKEEDEEELSFIGSSHRRDSEASLSSNDARASRVSGRRRTRTSANIFSNDNDDDHPYLSSQNRTESEDYGSDLEITGEAQTPKKKRKVFSASDRSSTLRHAPASSTRREASPTRAPRQPNPPARVSARTAPSANPTPFRPERPSQMYPQQGRALFFAVRAHQHFIEISSDEAPRIYIPAGVVYRQGDAVTELPVFLMIVLPENRGASISILYRIIRRTGTGFTTNPIARDAMSLADGANGSFLVNWMRSIGVLQPSDHPRTPAIQRLFTPDRLQSFANAFSEWAGTVDVPALRRSYIQYFESPGPSTRPAAARQRPQAQGSLSLEGSSSRPSDQLRGSGGGVRRLVGGTVGVRRPLREEDDFEDDEEEVVEDEGRASYGQSDRGF